MGSRGASSGRDGYGGRQTAFRIPSAHDEFRQAFVGSNRVYDYVTKEYTEMKAPKGKTLITIPGYRSYLVDNKSFEYLSFGSGESAVYSKVDFYAKGKWAPVKNYTIQHNIAIAMKG